MNVETTRALYEYHWWANRRLYTVTAGLGEELARRELGAQFSTPTLKSMFAHLYGADRIWLARWQGESPTGLAGDADFPTMAGLRTVWDALEQEQRAFVTGLGVNDLARTVEYANTSGQRFSLPLWSLLQHVANHATHHRSEIASMLTIVSGSPPDTGIVTFHLARTGQAG